MLFTISLFVCIFIFKCVVITTVNKDLSIIISRTEYNDSSRISYYSKENAGYILEQDIYAQTWTIFQEQNGIIVVKLRCYGTHGGQGSLNLATDDQGGELSFKRKSAKQKQSKRQRKS